MRIKTITLPSRCRWRGNCFGVVVHIIESIATNSSDTCCSRDTEPNWVHGSSRACCSAGKNMTNVWWLRHDVLKLHPCFDGSVWSGWVCCVIW
jgi:hypothetical protein